MKRLVLIVILAVLAMAKMASHAWPVAAKNTSITTSAASTMPSGSLVPSRPSRPGRFLLDNVAALQSVMSLSESAALLLLGSGLISAGVLFRRRIGRSRASAESYNRNRS
jgi:hypothetical protein